jgi:hypothetical protein
MSWENLGGIYISGPQGGTIRFAGREATTPNIVGPYYTGESTWYDGSSSATGQNTTLGSTKRMDPRYTDQFLNPHIITSYGAVGGTTYEHIHVSYYDTKDGSTKYRYNRRNAAQLRRTTNTNPQDTNEIPNNVGRADCENLPKMWTNLDGGFDNEDVLVQTAIGPFPAVAANYRVVNYGTTTANTARPVTAGTEGFNGTYTRYTGINAGEHNAIAVTSQGYPVVAYYDATNQKLKLALSGAVNPVDSRNWITVDALPDSGAGSAYKLGTGQYVSIAIDNGRAAPATGGTSVVQQNRIHIAAMSTNGNLVYIRGLITPPTPRTGTSDVYTANGGSFTLQTVQIVDSVGTVGRWCKISLDQFGNPWIAYQDDGKIGSTQGAKIAYRGGAFTKVLKDANGTEITGWETMHVPVQQSRVENPTISGNENGRLGLECFPTRNNAANNGVTQFWDAAVSYYTSYPQTRYRIAYYVR